MQELKWSHTKEEHIKLLKESNGYCLICQKPVSRRYHLCLQHCHSLYHEGLERKRVKIQEIKPKIKEYTYYLYYKIVGHQIDYKEREPVENRTKNRLTKQDIQEAIARLSSLKLPERYKTVHIDNQEDKLYLKKILLHLTYFYIAYYTKNSRIFKTEAHFNATVSNFVFTVISRNYFKRINLKGLENIANKAEFRRKYTYPRAKELISIFSQIDNILKQILLKI